MAAHPVFTLQSRNFSAMNLEGEMSGKRMRCLEISGLGRGDARPWPAQRGVILHTWGNRLPVGFD
jgi:hypothetical protein